MPNKPRIGLLLGDPTGIGPEIVARLMADPSTADQAYIAIIGDPRVWQAGREIADNSSASAHLDSIPTIDVLPTHWPDQKTPVLLHALSSDASDAPSGQVSAAAGRYALDSLRIALEFAQSGQLDAVCFAPLNKQAMHEAGSPFEDDLRYAMHVLEYDGNAGELNVLDNLWTARVTSHVPLRDVAALITVERVCQAVELIDSALHSAGKEKPHIAVAGLNPHAGEGGLFGSEEIEIIAPAVAKMQASGVQVSGPYPSDTVFLKARAGKFDAVVTMYHDQGQVAMKLMGFEQGVTVHGGLPIVVTTPAHGTAFDIAGQGKANPAALQRAFALACEMTG